MAVQTVFERRFESRRAELEWLYMELYGNRERLEELEEMMRRASAARSRALKLLDDRREKAPLWYREGRMLGVTMYTELFAGDISGLTKKLDYLSEQGVTYLHLMPLLKMPHPDNDGGYAVEDFDTVDPTLGTNEQLETLTKEMRKRGMSLCLDFVMNHTADTHEWAVRARAGEREYVDRYITFDSPDIPREMEKTIPDVFPETAPGSFIYDEQMGRWVCSSFHRYQWDLNYRNPAVFNDMAASMLHLANLGVEVLRVDATPYLWKELGTSCRNLPKVHTIMRMVRLVTEPSARLSYSRARWSWPRGSSRPTSARRRSLNAMYYIIPLLCVLSGAHSRAPMSGSSSISWMTCTACPGTVSSSITCAAMTT